MYDKIGLNIVRFLSFANLIAWIFTDHMEFIIIGIYVLCVLNDMQIQNLTELSTTTVADIMRQ